jgi:hypothetical protein
MNHPLAASRTGKSPERRAAQPTGAEVRSFPLHYFPASKELFRRRNSSFEGTAGGSLGGRFDAADFAAGGNAANAAQATTTKRPKLGVPGQAGDIFVMPTDSCRHESCFALRWGRGPFGEFPWPSLSARHIGPLHPLRRSGLLRAWRSSRSACLLARVLRRGSCRHRELCSRLAAAGSGAAPNTGVSAGAG